MSIFGKIKDAIFGHKSAPAQAQPAPAPQPTGDDSSDPNSDSAAASNAAGRCRAGADKHRQREGQPGFQLRSSIVDLMKLLGMDSSLENRKELATELGYKGPTDGSAEMNIWLHKEVMRQLAAHGGKVPANLTD